MIRMKQAAALLIAAALLSTAMAPAALAASKKKVGKINLTINTDIRTGSSGGEVDVTATGDNTSYYYVDAAEVINDEGDDWTKSYPPEVEITLGLEDEDEYTFSGTSSSSFKFTLDSSIKSRFDKIKFVDAKKMDSGATMVVTVQLIFDEDADTSKASAPGDVKWDSSHNGYGSWSDVSAAKYFQVQLYKNGSIVSSPDGSSSTTAVYATSYDFSSWLTGEGSYQFKVRSVKSSNSAKSSWVSSDTWKVDANGATENTNQTPPSANGGSWQKAADGIRWWWQNTDGSYPASQWKQIDGQWYYFNADGYMATGWITVDNISYYLDTTNGAMYTNRRTPDNYWVNESGAWVPGM